MSVCRKITLFILILCLCQQMLCAPTVPATEPPPPPPEPLPSDYAPPPMTEEWQLEMNWEDWYWANLAQDYLNNRLTPEQEQILLNHVDLIIEQNESNFVITADNVAWALARMLDVDYWVSYGGHLYPSTYLPSSTGGPVLELW